jgi:hypothetical protein
LDAVQQSAAQHVANTDRGISDPIARDIRRDDDVPNSPEISGPPKDLIKLAHNDRSAAQLSLDNKYNWLESFPQVDDLSNGHYPFFSESLKLTPEVLRSIYADATSTKTVNLLLW